MRTRLALIVALLAVGGCGRGMISVDAIEGGVRDVTRRHAIYVTADPNLTDAQKATYLRTGELLLKVLDTAKEGQP